VACQLTANSDDSQPVDTDNDGLSDVDEAKWGTNPNLADTDGDGVSDGVEINERTTSPLLADTDGDGTSDATDLVTFANCTSRTLPAPRLIAPLSTSNVTDRRPTLRWQNDVSAEGAVIQLCADRACTTVLQTINATGTSAEPSTDLPPGPVF